MDKIKDIELEFNQKEINSLLEKLNFEAKKQAQIAQRKLPPNTFTLVVERLEKNLRIFIRPNENNHNIPHFHVETTSYSGSYSINPIERLSGNMPSRLEKIFKKWVSEHQNLLLNKWEELRPTN